MKNLLCFGGSNEFIITAHTHLENNKYNYGPIVDEEYEVTEE